MLRRAESDAQANLFDALKWVCVLFVGVSPRRSCKNSTQFKDRLSELSAPFERPCGVIQRSGSEPDSLLGVLRQFQLTRSSDIQSASHTFCQSAGISNNPAAPMPPPMHMVTSPNPPPRRFSSLISVSVNFVPVIPSG